MLHVKLPKGKTADALVKLAVRYEARYHWVMRDFNADLEAWRKDYLNLKKDNPGLPPNTPSREFQTQAHKLYRMAGACSASVGDVYISAQLWDEIKGEYDA